MQTLPTPRVNKEMLQRYPGKTVRLVGRVTGVGHGVFEMQAADNGIVKVEIAPGNSGNMQAGCVVEIVGKVKDNQTVEEYNSTLFNPEFNFETYNQMVVLAEQYPNIFHSYPN